MNKKEPSQMASVSYQDVEFSWNFKNISVPLCLNSFQVSLKFIYL